MHVALDRMIGAFEQGKLTRRQLISRLGAFVAAMAGSTRLEAAGQKPSTFEAVGLNHIALNVSNVPRSREFYKQHLGLKVLRQSPSNCFLGCGDHFVALFQDAEPGLDHYCYSIKDYKPEEVVKKLNTVGLKPRRHSNRVYFDDPDGITVQVAAGDHRP